MVFVGITLTAGVSSALAKGGKPVSASDDVASVTTDADNEVTETPVDELLDYNELTHLIFMREEEKLARDVYIPLGTMYPDAVIFGNIDDSEQRHMTVVKNMQEQYGYEDSNTNDKVGNFTGEAYVQHIEKHIGAGNYQAQVLSQEQADEILDR